ncbi:MAG: fluoride efflux transporter CrcB [Epsilonproteobacteria bacterium]|nr:fluoride efflux transporter CrcB [Campylobacterota bacterium]
MSFTHILAVGLGGFFGAISRFLLSFWVQKLTNSLFPFGTLTVNVIGSFLIGWLFLYFSYVINPTLKAFLVTGFLGALTTFSTFSLETVLLLQDGVYLKALFNIFLNVSLSIVSTILAIILFKKIYGGV